MRYIATKVDNNTIMIRMIPGWLGRLFGRGERTVYAKRGVSMFNLEGWFLPSGRRIEGDMEDAINGLNI